MGKFNFIDTKIKDLYIIKPQILGDPRGYFMESYNKKDFYDVGLNMDFVQDNESKSKKGVLRGLHFQISHPQGKLVRVTSGKVFDVAVDLRADSPTFSKYVSVVLTGKNKKQLYIPEGFAHGFLVLSEFATFNYKCTDYYNPEYESGILWTDNDISVNWPMDQIDEVFLSDKDKNQKTLREIKILFNIKEHECR
ncbi:dTDP-4-dehydrorhamnose 3,5-epimerase [Clostridium algoriphilum]|uniref:dTDP-4-dehydrorhamnose 3,5-epimerase n=1 Tax=Clostridium algoriphilum TaxID=198347 RepID=UPI001CF152B6|nr:dTDP-4-dehydrorhamnose 3,5-epimerase [Clostridium algoriphilum]MCB2296001.1 dTDP-4-dehydrorhamnose 3,5-epimerase [Clostridium algoriphilum]